MCEWVHAPYLPPLAWDFAGTVNKTMEREGRKVTVILTPLPPPSLAFPHYSSSPRNPTRSVAWAHQSTLCLVVCLFCLEQVGPYHLPVSAPDSRRCICVRTGSLANWTHKDAGEVAVVVRGRGEATKFAKFGVLNQHRDSKTTSFFLKALGCIFGFDSLLTTSARMALTWQPCALLLLFLSSFARGVVMTNSTSGKYVMSFFGALCSTRAHKRAAHKPPSCVSRPPPPSCCTGATYIYGHLRANFGASTFNETGEIVMNVADHELCDLDNAVVSGSLSLSRTHSLSQPEHPA